MGIYDRDYMKRPRDEATRVPSRPGSAGDNVEAFFRRLLRRHPRLPILLMAVVIGLILAGFLLVAVR